MWSKKAKIQLQRILDFYFERNKSITYSLKLLRETEELLDNISKTEFIGRLSANQKTRVIPLREYEINENSIEVISILHNKQFSTN